MPPARLGQVIRPGELAAVWPNLLRLVNRASSSFSSRCHDLRPILLCRRFGPKLGMVIWASSLFSSECHAPPNATVLGRPVSSESLFSPPAKEQTHLPNAGSSVLFSSWCNNNIIDNMKFWSALAILLRIYAYFGVVFTGLVYQN